MRKLWSHLPTDLAGCKACEQHDCGYGKPVDARGLHGLTSRKSGPKQQRHSHLSNNWPVARTAVYYLLLLARLMGQYCFARWRLSASVVVVYNTAGRQARGRAGRAGGRASDTARRVSRVTSR